MTFTPLVRTTALFYQSENDGLSICLPDILCERRIAIVDRMNVPEGAILGAPTDRPDDSACESTEDLPIDILRRNTSDVMNAACLP